MELALFVHEERVLYNKEDHRIAGEESDGFSCPQYFQMSKLLQIFLSLWTQGYIFTFYLKQH